MKQRIQVPPYYRQTVPEEDARDRRRKYYYGGFTLLRNLGDDEDHWKFYNRRGEVNLSTDLDSVVQQVQADYREHPGKYFVNWVGWVAFWVAGRWGIEWDEKEWIPDHWEYRETDDREVVYEYPRSQSKMDPPLGEHGTSGSVDRTVEGGTSE